MACRVPTLPLVTGRWIKSFSSTTRTSSCASSCISTPIFPSSPSSSSRTRSTSLPSSRQTQSCDRVPFSPWASHDVAGKPSQQSIFFHLPRRSFGTLQRRGGRINNGGRNTTHCPELRSIGNGLAVVSPRRHQQFRWAPAGRARMFSGWRAKEREQILDNMGWYIGGAVLAAFSVVWIAVPLYRLYCQQSGQGLANTNHKEYQMPPAENYENPRKLIKITFESTVHDALNWNVRTQQKHIVLAPGETALAFYRAKNNLKHPVIGTSVYHIMPAEAGLYFNKIQCFCFDEQLLNPDEEVDLPILFFIEPELAADVRFENIDEISLSYIFFESDSEIPEEYQELMEQRKFQQEKRENLVAKPDVAPAPIPVST